MNARVTGQTQAATRVQWHVALPLWLVATSVVVVQLVLVAALILGTTSQAPYLDEWATADIVRLSLHGGLRPSDLWANHGEHILLVPRLWNLPLVLLTHWDRRAMMLAQLAIMLIGLGLLLRAQRRALGTEAAWLAPPTTLLLLSCIHFENWLSPFQFQFIGIVVAACCCTWAFSRREVSGARFALAVAGALAASLSGVPGVLLWAAFAPAVWWSGRRRLAVWCPVGIAMVAVVALGERPVKAMYPRAPLSAEHLAFALGYLGLPLAYPFALLGVATGAVGVVVAAWALWRCRADLSRVSPWLGLLAFSGGCAALTTIGRGPGLGALTSRYLAFAVLWWIATATLVARAWRQQGPPRAGYGRAAAIIGAALLVAGAAAGDAGGFVAGGQYQAAARAADACVLAYASAEDGCLRASLPVPDLVRVHAAYLAEDRLGPFAGSDAPALPVQAVGSAPPDLSAWQPAATTTRARVDWCHVLVATPHVEPVVVPPSSPLALGGRAVDDVAQAPAAGVVVAIDGIPVWLAEYGVEPPDIFGRTKDLTYPRSGFRAIIPASALVPGLHEITIRILAQDGRHYYTTPQRIAIDVR